MKFYDILKFDFYRERRDTLKNAVCLICVFSFIFICSVFRTFHLYAYYLRNPQNIEMLSISIGDLWMLELGGILLKSTETNNFFLQFPIAWFFTNLLVLYFTLNIMHNDLSQEGIQIITRIKDLRKWWHSKCLWNMLTVFLYNSVGIIVFSALSALTGKSSTLQLNSSIFEMNYAVPLENCQNQNILLLLCIFILPTLVSMTISLGQMLISLYLKPTISFLVCCIYVILSIYFVSPFFIYNYAMPIRSSIIGVYNFAPITGIAVCILMCTLFVSLGEMKVRKMDILSQR